MHTITSQLPIETNDQNLVNIVISNKSVEQPIINALTTSILQKITLNTYKTLPLELYTIYINNKKYIAVKDSGCQLMIMSKRLANILGCQLNYNVPKAIILDGTQLLIGETLEKITFVIKIEKYNKKFSFETKFSISDFDQSFDIMLGLPFIATLYPDTYTLNINGYPLKALEQPILTDDTLKIKEVQLPLIGLIRNTLEYGDDIQHERL